MDELQLAILALLQSKFAGVRKDGLQQLAAVISVQVANEEEANEVVGKLTADKVSKFVTDWRKTTDAEIAKANKTHEDGLRRKYDFKEKEAPGEPKPGEETPPTGGALTAEQIRAIVREENKTLRDEYASFRAEKTATTRREQFVAKLDAAKIEGKQRDLLLRNFDRVTFKDDDDFNGYLTEMQGDIDAIAQEQSDHDLNNHEKPVFGAVNKDGISAGVADYIASQSESKPTLSGKEV